MSYNLSPLFNGVSQFDASGNLLVGGKLYWYEAGTTTPVTVYKDSGGASSQAQPIVLNSRGTPDYPIWLLSGQSYKAVLADANDVTLQTIDNIIGINDNSAAAVNSEWVAFAGAPTYVDATHFSVAGDQRTTFQQYRRVRATVTAGTVYGVISAAPTYAAGVTSVTVTLDSGSLDAGLTAVAVGILGAQNQSVPSQFNQSLGILGDLTLDRSDSNVDATLTIDAKATQSAATFIQSDGVLRWSVGRGANGHFAINRWDSSGVYQSTPLAVDDATGDIRLNGRLIQVGVGTVADGTGGFSVTFPTAFADAHYFVVCTATTIANHVSIYSKTSSGFSGYVQTITSVSVVNAANGDTVDWIAIGG